MEIRQITKPIVLTTRDVISIMSGSKTQLRIVAKGQSICRYSVGDILWLKEPHYSHGKWIDNGTTKKGSPAFRFEATSLPYRYGEDTPENARDYKSTKLGWYSRNIPFMKMEASRASIEITSIRRERLIRISEDDAIKEGVDYQTINAKESYRTLWQSINGEKSWDYNPMVWAIEFKLI